MKIIEIVEMGFSYHLSPIIFPLLIASRKRKITVGSIIDCPSRLNEKRTILIFLTN